MEHFRNLKKLLGLCTAITAVMMADAQPFKVGHKQQTFTDASRSNRGIPAEIYYPAVSAGDTTPIASGTFPVVVFGHGFVMETGAYNVVWNAIVPAGYIVVLPTTESSISPNHNDFGLDLAFLVTAMKNEGKKSGSTFYNAIATTSAVMGHSMGGGAAFLAMAADPSITAMATFAAAVTNPSSVAAAKKIKKPALVFSASADCVAPTASHQTPMYDSLLSDCKTYISISGGSHCQFASSNVNCSLGELICFPKASISGSEQQSAAFGLLLPWLNYYLKNDKSGASAFQTLISEGKGIKSKQNCDLLTNAGFTDIGDGGLNIYPNPAMETVHVKMPWEGQIELYSVTGQLRFSQQAAAGNTQLTVPPGISYIRITISNQTQTFRVIGHQ